MSEIVTKVPVNELVDALYLSKLPKYQYSQPHFRHLLGKILSQVAQDPSSIEKLKKSHWLFLHTTMCNYQSEHDSFFDTNLHNIFIQDLGRRFDNLNAFQCVVLAKNMSVVGTNQVDIMEAIVDKAITEKPNVLKKEKLPVIFFNLLTAMINLNMQNTDSFNKVLEQVTAHKDADPNAHLNVDFDGNIDRDITKEFILGVLARDLTSNPAIKPIVSLFFFLISAFFSSTSYCKTTSLTISQLTLIHP